MIHERRMTLSRTRANELFWACRSASALLALAISLLVLLALVFCYDPRLPSWLTLPLVVGGVVFARAITKFDRIAQTFEWASGEEE